jgi:hypothetical protein
MTNPVEVPCGRDHEPRRLGCRNEAVLQGNHDGGCITTCASLDDAAKDGDKCAGNGCCQTAMPGDLNEVRVGWSRGGRVNSAWNYSSCVYGFIAEKGSCVMILSFYLFLKMMIV